MNDSRSAQFQPQSPCEEDDEPRSPQAEQLERRRRLEHLADEVLDAYGRWDGGSSSGEVLARLHPAIIPWSPAAAQVVANRAHWVYRASKDAAHALALIQAACDLDPAAALDQFHHFKVDLALSRGRRADLFARELYTLGCDLAAAGEVADAARAYQAAARLDPAFLWPDNNYAWLVSTGAGVTPAVSSTGLPCAQRACAASGWNYWAFLGTLAASYAAAGDCERAGRWQRIVLRLAPTQHRVDARTALACYEAGRRLVDPGFAVAAGEAASIDAPDAMQIAELRGALDRLLGLPGAALA
jgi:tetratricopeptide (TPR) repeat protein